MMFYKETNFKETPFGRIPKDWGIKKLSEITNYTKGRKPEKLYDEKISEATLPYLTAEYMRGLEKPKWCDSQDNQKLVRVKEDEIIMIWDGSYAGNVFTGFNGILASTMVKIVPNQEINRKFLYYFLTKNFQVFRGTTTGTGIPHVNKKVFDDFLVPIPSTNEQQKIAEILSTVDEAVQKINEIIAKTERLKKGLMQELLTKGIGHKEFKDTEIGRIPKEWEVVTLGEVAVEVYRYPTYYDIKYVDANKGIPEVRSELIKENGELEENLNKYRFISKETSQKFLRTILQEGDFVLSVRGTMGKVAIVPKFLEGANITANLMRISLDRSKCYSPFFKQVFLSDSFRKILNNLSSQTTIKTIQAPRLKSIKVPLPPFQEQQRIAEILSVVDKKLQLEREEKTKLERIKQGLMDLLLTGRIRVKVN
jgi:type I restriction enzyme S subunit